MAAAINILLDAVFTIQGTNGGDDGVTSGRTPAGSPITFKADKVKPKIGRRLADHSTEQDLDELNRTTKITRELSVETKLDKTASAPLLTLLMANTGIIVQFTCTATGANITSAPYYGIVENVEWEYAGPSTLRFNIKPYGQAWSTTTT